MRQGYLHYSRERCGSWARGCDVLNNSSSNVLLKLMCSSLIIQNNIRGQVAEYEIEDA